MDIKGTVCVVTGGAEGIGRALALGLKARGAKAVVVVDRNLAGAEATGREVGGLGLRCDVASESDIAAVIAATEKAYGAIDLFCSNAGIGEFGADMTTVASAPDALWQRCWQVNVMSHVYAARALLPGMIGRKRGYFLNTVSAAGLLNQIGGPIYGTTKHAAIGFAENLAFTHRDDGIRVSVLCPQGVDTTLLKNSGHGPQHLDGVITPEACASSALDGIEKETFCILPHPRVVDYMRAKTADYERWISGMAKLQQKLRAGQV